VGSSGGDIASTIIDPTIGIIEGKGGNGKKKKRTGFGFIDDIINDPIGAIEDVVDVGTQISTGGFLGYEDGGIKQGVLTGMLDEGLGELTGRNLARGEANRAEVRLQAEDEKRKKDLLNLQEQNFRQDFAASSGARAIRRSAQAKYGGSLGMGSGRGTDERDFLGL